jgi:hypothetical protein
MNKKIKGAIFVVLGLGVAVFRAMKPEPTSTENIIKITLAFAIVGLGVWTFMRKTEGQDPPEKTD